jgi:hypothetical protein
MINAPITATSRNRYMARADRRVKSHIRVSKFRPRFVRGNVLDFIAILPS